MSCLGEIENKRHFHLTNGTQDAVELSARCIQYSQGGTQKKQHGFFLTKVFFYINYFCGTLLLSNHLRGDLRRALQNKDIALTANTNEIKSAQGFDARTHMVSRDTATS